ncbi:MAG: winged helix-turn-helix domain-containing protein [Candidatus Omnitrophica bacterium]|nr:winged helix-turn-helix domain-containing protein [Candidatus Omnitrophota bacterium]
MITRIGIVAGEIWQLLESNENMTLSEIKTKLDKPEYLILMSLGWLSREGHVLVNQDKNQFVVSLRRKKDLEAVKE